MKKKRREKTHERIARMFNVKPNYVMHILKIGDVNPEYFDRLRKGRIARYVAYSACISEQRQEYPPVPTDKEPIHFTPETGEEPIINLKQVQTIMFTCSTCNTEHEIPIPVNDEKE